MIDESLQRSWVPLGRIPLMKNIEESNLLNCYFCKEIKKHERL